MDAQTGKYLRKLAADKGTLNTAPEGVEFEIEEGKRGPTVTIWSGKGNKPVEFCRVRDLKRAEELVAQWVERSRAARVRKADEKKRRASAVEEMRNQIKVGSIIRYSWGYEQTQVYFYQVVAKSQSGATITLRRIAGKQVEATGPMSANVAPCPGSFLDGDPIKKKVSQFGVRFKHGNGYPCEQGASFHSSWGY